MNPFVRGLLESVIRKAITALGAFLMTKGLLTESSAAELVAGLSALAISLVWSYFDQKKKQEVIGAALALPAGSTKHEAVEASKLPEAPPASLPANVPVRPIGG
jgi:hypothetical protein